MKGINNKNAEGGENTFMFGDYTDGMRGCKPFK